MNHWEDFGTDIFEFVKYQAERGDVDSQVRVLYKIADFLLRCLMVLCELNEALLIYSV